MTPGSVQEAVARDLPHPGPKDQKNSALGRFVPAVEHKTRTAEW